MWPTGVGWTYCPHINNNSPPLSLFCLPFCSLFVNVTVTTASQIFHRHVASLYQTGTSFLYTPPLFSSSSSSSSTTALVAPAFAPVGKCKHFPFFKLLIKKNKNKKTTRTQICGKIGSKGGGGVKWLVEGNKREQSGGRGTADLLIKQNVQTKKISWTLVRQDVIWQDLTLPVHCLSPDNSRGITHTCAQTHTHTEIQFPSFYVLFPHSPPPTPPTPNCQTVHFTVKPVKVKNRKSGCVCQLHVHSQRFEQFLHHVTQSPALRPLPGHNGRLSPGFGQSLATSGSSAQAPWELPGSDEVSVSVRNGPRGEYGPETSWVAGCCPQPVLDLVTGTLPILNSFNLHAPYVMLSSHVTT